MQKQRLVLGILVALLFCLAWRPVAAVDAEVRYIITNGGENVGGRGTVMYYPPGRHDDRAEISSAPSGGSVRMPDGTYDVHVTFSDGTARWEKWIEGQAFTGNVERTVEVAQPITEIRYIITNGGENVGGRGTAMYYPPGRHDDRAEISSAPSGGSVRMPDGTYDVHVTFSDGTARWEKWIEGQAFTGTVERTVEVAQPMTEIRYLITNGGENVGGRGTVMYYPPGKHDDRSEISSAPSGGSVRMPEGTYDVYVTFSDGTSRWEKWFEGQAFNGNVERTVEVAQPITEIRYVITNGGADVGGRGTVRYYPPGKHEDRSEISSAPSGGSVRMPEGTYDVYATFMDGTSRWEKWFEGQAFTGTVERTVEVARPITEIRYVITNGGADVGGRGTVRYYPPGKHDDRSEISSAPSGGSVRMPEGTYDVYVTFNDGTAHREIWLVNQEFSGKVERTVEVARQVAEIHITVTNGGIDVGGKGVVTYFSAGKHDGPGISSAPSGGAVRMPEDTYDVRVTFTDGAAHKEGWLNGQAFSGKVDKTIELGLTLAEPTVTVTQDGADVGDKASIAYAAPSDHRIVGGVASSEPLVIEAGHYDIRAQIGDAEAWLRGADVTGKPRFTIDLPPRPTAFAPPPPAATAEAVDPARGDFPYLPPLPGSRFIEGKSDQSPVYVRAADAKTPDLVANGSIMKVYRLPDSVTFPMLLGTYRDALIKSGWTIVNLSSGVEGMAAHNGQNGRNIWAFIRVLGDNYVLVVADATIAAGKLLADLGTQCHLALTGVLFDFNKSTLKPESDPVLAQVGVLMADHARRLEIQGHTDNIGSDAYNQPLSEARARSVVDWLTRHGVMTDRLSARGYGKSRPVATNATDEGRARNRRVEIADPACTAR